MSSVSRERRSGEHRRLLDVYHSADRLFAHIDIAIAATRLDFAYGARAHRAEIREDVIEILRVVAGCVAEVEALAFQKAEDASILTHVGIADRPQRMSQTAVPRASRAHEIGGLTLVENIQFEDSGDRRYRPDYRIPARSLNRGPYNGVVDVAPAGRFIDRCIHAVHYVRYSTA